LVLLEGDVEDLGIDRANSNPEHLVQFDELRTLTNKDLSVNLDYREHNTLAALEDWSNTAS